MNAYGPRPPAALTPVVSAALTSDLGRQPCRRGLGSGKGLQLERCEHEDRELLRVVVRRPFAWTVNVKTPLWVGVPEITPFGLSVSPAGSAPPASVHELTVPPDAVSAGAVYALR